MGLIRFIILYSLYVDNDNLAVLVGNKITNVLPKGQIATF